MKRSTAPWTTAIAAAAIFAMPVGGWAQQTSPATPSSTSRPAGAETGQQGAAHEHLRQAKTALTDIPAASLTGTAKTRVAELKRHLTSLEQSAGAGDTASAGATAAAKSSKGASASKSGWSSDVAAADRILTELLGAQPASGATEPGAAGTSGAAGASKQTSGRIALDETTRAKLQEVRAHLTAFAASMSGSPSSGKSEPQASASPAAPEAQTTAASQPEAASPAQDQAAQASPTPAEPAAAEPASPRPTAQASSDPAAATPTGTSGTAAAQSSQPQAGASTQPETASQPVDADTVKRHLTAARDSLSQLTQLPQAAQLTGDARTQVSQLISNFNELITTNVDWRSAYAKVDANLNTLIGDQRTDESATPTANPQGAVGTSGTVSLDPALRAKLVEMRTHLVEFEKAAGGSGASASSMPPSASSAPAASSTNTASPGASPETSSSTTASAASSTSSTPGATSSAGVTSENPAPAGTSGASASTPSPAAASGSAGVDAQGQPSGAKSADSADRKQASSSDDKQAGHAEAMRHIEAIEAILNGGSGSKTAGTSGSATGANRPGSANTASSLDRAQIEQIRTHLNELRRSMSQR